MKRPALAVALALTLVSVTVPALAQQDPATEAREQYGLGTKAFQARRYSEAALHFEAAAGFRANGVALFTAGLAWEKAGKPDRAADAYARSLDVPGLDAGQSQTAKDKIAQLEKSLGTLVVTGPAGWKVQLDTLTEVPTPGRLHGSPGPHVLSVRAPGKPIDRRDVNLEAGKVTDLALEEPTAPTPVAPTPTPIAPPPPPPVVHESPWTLRRSVGFGVAGLGVAALGAGILFGLNANSAADTYNAAPTREAFDHASSLETLTNVALIGGGILVAGGVALIVIPSGDGEGSVRVGPAPGGAVVTGRF